MTWAEARAVLRERRIWLDQIIASRAGCGASIRRIREERDALDVVLRESDRWLVEDRPQARVR